MNNYEFSYKSSDSISVTPEEYLKLKSSCSNIQVLKIIPPSLAKDDYGQIVIVSPDTNKEIYDVKQFTI